MLEGTDFWGSVTTGQEEARQNMRHKFRGETTDQTIKKAILKTSQRNEFLLARKYFGGSLIVSICNIAAWAIYNQQKNSRLLKSTVKACSNHFLKQTPSKLAV